MCKIKQQFQGNPYLTAFVFIMVFAFILWFAGVIFHDSWLGGGELQGSGKIGWVQIGVFFGGLDTPFNDFFWVAGLASDRSPYSIWGGNYLPLAYLICYPFGYLNNSATQTLEQYAQTHNLPVAGIYEGIGSNVILVFAVLFIMFLVFLLFFALNALRKKYKLPAFTLIGLFTSSVMLFSIERGNLILLSADCIIFFLCFYDSENKTERILAAVALAIAAVLKVYPVLFGLLYLKNKQFKEAVFSAVCAALLTFVPFLFLKGGFNNIFLLIECLKEFSSNNDFTASELTPLNPANIVYRGLLPFVGEDKAYFYGYLARIATLALSVLSLALLFITKNKWIGITLLSISVLFISDSSVFYCGLYLFPCILYFFATVKERPAAFNIFILIVFLIVLKPYQIALPFAGGKTNVLISTFVLSVLWLALMVRCITAYCRRVCAAGVSAGTPPEAARG